MAEKLSVSKLNSIPEVLAVVEENKHGIKEFLDVLILIVFFGNTYRKVTDPESPGGEDITTMEILGIALKDGLTLKKLVTDAISGFNKIGDELTDTITDDEQKAIMAVLTQLEWFKENQQLEQATKDHIEVVRKLKSLLHNYYGIG